MILEFKYFRKYETIIMDRYRKGRRDDSEKTEPMGSISINRKIVISARG